MITMIVGDIDEELSVYSKSIDSNASLLLETDSVEDNKCYYLSIADYTSYDNFVKTLEKANKIIYHSPVQWSDSDSENNSEIKEATEKALLFFYNRKIIVNFSPKLDNKTPSFKEYIEAFKNNEASADDDFNIDDFELEVFPPMFYKFNYEFDWKTLEPVINSNYNKIPENVNAPGPNVLSTIYINESLPHTWPEFQPFMEFMDKIIKQLIVKNKLSNWSSTAVREQKFASSYKISYSWLNQHGPGGQLREHHHSPATFVVSCYIKAPKNSGKLLLRDPLEYHKSYWAMNDYGSYDDPMDIRRDFYRWSEIEVDTNDVIIFPGFVNHIVTPNQNPNDERVVLGLLVYV